MRFVCDAPRGHAWFQIETEAEAALESDLMNHAVEKHFRQAREHAIATYVPPSGSYIEENIGLKAHLERIMPIFLTLRDQEGKGLATAILPPPTSRSPILDAAAGRVSVLTRLRRSGDPPCSYLHRACRFERRHVRTGGWHCSRGPTLQ